MRTTLRLLVCVVAACSSPAKPAPAPTNVTTPAKPDMATQTCDEGLYLWDPTAKECRPFPGGPYGKAGCSERETNPPGDHPCFTGSTWDKHCDCACDKGAWDATAKACK